MGEALTVLKTWYENVPLKEIFLQHYLYCTFLQSVVHGNIGAVRRTHVTGEDFFAALYFFQNIGMDLQL
jgi:hypothetical protein